MLHRDKDRNPLKGKTKIICIVHSWNNPPIMSTISRLITGQIDIVRRICFSVRSSAGLPLQTSVRPTETMPKTALDVFRKGAEDKLQCTTMDKNILGISECCISGSTEISRGVGILINILSP